MIWAMLFGASIMLVGMTLGWAMANTQFRRENHTIDINIHDGKRKEDLD